jgi:hypothetical protein
MMLTHIHKWYMDRGTCFCRGCGAFHTTCFDPYRHGHRWWHYFQTGKRQLRKMIKELEDAKIDND